MMDIPIEHGALRCIFYTGPFRDLRGTDRVAPEDAVACPESNVRSLAYRRSSLPRITASDAAQIALRSCYKQVLETIIALRVIVGEPGDMPHSPTCWKAAIQYTKNPYICFRSPCLN
ncbi:unnamed protein product [Hermetia illucens]|uniref:Uncharacterized protein n=1 Tax=Hermetia illucens TaxID=343691 RepID=A0A7R8Z2G1_HERIL|nr:unnamed protein product [Hermetia illucens]